MKNATNTTPDNARGMSQPIGLGNPIAPTVGLLGKDTRPTFKLNGLDGKPVKVPSAEESLYLIYCELALLRRYQAIRVNQGMK